MSASTDQANLQAQPTSDPGAQHSDQEDCNAHEFQHKADTTLPFTCAPCKLRSCPDADAPPLQITAAICSGAQTGARGQFPTTGTTQQRTPGDCTTTRLQGVQSPGSSRRTVLSVGSMLEQPRGGQETGCKFSRGGQVTEGGPGTAWCYDAVAWLQTSHALRDICAGSSALTAGAGATEGLVRTWRSGEGACSVHRARTAQTTGSAGQLPPTAAQSPQHPPPLGARAVAAPRELHSC